MNLASRILFDGFSTLFQFFENSCKPDSRHFKDKIQQDLAHHRNKAFAIFHFCACILYILQAMFLNIPILKNTMGVGPCIGIMTLIVIAPRINPGLWKTLYNVLIALFGPLVMYIFEGGIHRSWIGTQLYPTVVLFCTGSVRHYLLQMGLQIIYIHTIYQSSMLQSINMTPPEELVKSLTQASTTCSLLNVLTIFCIYATLQNAYAKIVIVEKKKTEIENQKFFLLSFSHELRNLINSLMGNVRLASLENLTSKAHKFLTNADVCGELLLHLINNILDTGKVEVGELDINPTSTNIYQTIDKIWSICSELIRGKNLIGKLHVHNNLPSFVQVDPYRFSQILLNVIGNAVKYTQKGSVIVKIEWINNLTEVVEKSFEPYPFDDENELSEGIFEKEQMFTALDPNFKELTLSQSVLDQNLFQDQRNPVSVTNKGVLKVTVTDTGPGMSKDEISKLFQKFNQWPVDFSKRQLGTGLGLFITKQLCERMGGQIRVFSKQSKGSCFTICIPLTSISEIKSATNASKEITEIWNHHVRDLKVMVVDDEPFSQVILQNFFNKLHIEVSMVAKNGLEAYRSYVDHAMRGDPIPVITLDLTMPVMDGKEAAQRIRMFEDENGMRSCLIIVISGNCTESEIKECMDKNGRIRANAFIKKPAKIEDIYKVLSSFLGI